MTPNSTHIDPGSGDELARLLALILRTRLDSQAETIVELGRAGFGHKRIAELLGTTTNTVNVALHKAKGRSKAVQRTAAQDG